MKLGEVGDFVYVKNYASGNPWLQGKVLGMTMYSVLLNDGKNVRKHADQMRTRVANSITSNTSAELDPDDSLEMQVPQIHEGSNVSDKRSRPM